MPLLIFHCDAGDASVFVGDELGINLAKGQLDLGGAVLAAHRDGSWYIHHVAVRRITCEGPVCLTLHGTSGKTNAGSLTELTIGDNTIWSQQGFVARYNVFTRTWNYNPESQVLVHEPGVAAAASPR